MIKDCGTVYPYCKVTEMRYCTAKGHILFSSQTSLTDYSLLKDCSKRKVQGLHFQHPIYGFHHQAEHSDSGTRPRVPNLT